MKQFTPREIVEHLDKYIVRQDEAKRAIAVAMRNRWRRQQLPEDLREEVAPKNIIMIGPTGVGKTEIARRIAMLVQAPFIKVEATKYTEVGYVGRDVESIIRDLMELAVNMVRQEATEEVRPKAEEAAEERLLDILLPGSHWTSPNQLPDEAMEESREKMRKKLQAGILEDRTVEIDIEERVQVGFVGAGAQEEMAGLQEMFERFLPARTHKRRVSVREARQVLAQQEADKLIDRDQVITEARSRMENLGIVFLDELDKVAGSDARYGPDVSRQGVQRDLLPIVEGCTVGTRYGLVRTDHVLFIASGAFTASKPSDLMPELQGRFPIRVELKDLTKEDFVRILTEPKNALIKQQCAMLATEGVLLDFADDAIDEVASIAYRINQSTQNIGARRIYTVLEKLVEKVSFDAPEMKEKEVHIDAAYVNEQLADIAKDEDLSRYIL